MDPQPFIRLSIGSLSLRIPGASSNGTKLGLQSFDSPAVCEIRLQGFPVQTALVPIAAPEVTPDLHNVASSFYLEESDIKTMLKPGCFYKAHPCLEISVFFAKKGSHCGVGANRQQIGTYKLIVSPEWCQSKSRVLSSGWVGIGKGRQDSEKSVAELHLRVKLDPDPRYVFQFEDKTSLSPQIVQIQKAMQQPIFSCKFSQERSSQLDPTCNYWSGDKSTIDAERRERKGWKVSIHDLSGSAVAAAFITTPFVPSSGCDWVAKSNPGAWLIVRPDACMTESWQPWGKLEAWRERGISDTVCCRFHLLSEEQDGGSNFLMSEININAEKGGEFFIDTDKHIRPATNTPIPSPQSSGDFAGLSPVGGGFVMSCKIQGEGKRSKPLVQLAQRHVTCVEDAAIFMALAAAVDLSISACKPFRRKMRFCKRQKE
uniref:Uncharacterized protein n=1 Tax=Kalanchoe fedtschenkoi TaxID=63787 RepID=A0A7N0ZRI4_KALFE